MNQTVRLTAENFKSEVLECPLPVLVDFWSSWCPPCKMTEPVIDELAVELGGRVKVAKMNIDQNRGLADSLNVAGVPTFMFLKDGTELKREVGARSKKQLLKTAQSLGLVEL